MKLILKHLQQQKLATSQVITVSLSSLSVFKTYVMRNTGKGHLLKRRDTQYEFGQTTDAWRKFEGEEDSDEDDGNICVQ